MAGPGDVVLRAAERLSIALEVCVGQERKAVVRGVMDELTVALLEMSDADASRVVAALHRAASLVGGKKEEK